ncbi:MAG: hypothetical protein CSA62_11555 [Planctomycetota bacterium]|nr:MAG: hypothetical protein CSA62_11555 [Planctomycetota bacterium]
MRLLFVSPRFLFPADEGGKIRSSQILRGMKGGAFEITLASPSQEGEAEAHAEPLAEVCDHFVSWPARKRGSIHSLTRLSGLLSSLPISVRDDRDARAQRSIAAELAKNFDVVVFDFVHSLVLSPKELSCASVLFTHNVEFEIFERHAKVSSSRLARAVWSNQARKMRRLEQEALTRFDRIVAVSARDQEQFAALAQSAQVEVIPTGVDLDFFEWCDPSASERVVFTGALDWPANEDGIDWLLREVWPQVEAARPQAELLVIGRNPSRKLLEAAAPRRARFSGWVEDVRQHVAGAGAFVIPLRVGGGTRIKGYEACAAGPALVSTSIGVEGLSLEPEQHYLLADEAESFAQALIRLLSQPEARSALSQRARRHVEENCSFQRVAERFEQICQNAIESRNA